MTLPPSVTLLAATGLLATGVLVLRKTSRVCELLQKNHTARFLMGVFADDTALIKLSLRISSGMALLLGVLIAFVAFAFPPRGN